LIRTREGKERKGKGRQWKVFDNLEEGREGKGRGKGRKGKRERKEREGRAWEGRGRCLTSLPGHVCGYVCVCERKVFVKGREGKGRCFTGCVGEYMSERRVFDNLGGVCGWVCVRENGV